MMKIIHTSDWHLGQRFYRYDRDEEHLHFFRQLSALLSAEHPDALIVSGDIYDNPAPSAATQKMLVEALLGLHAASPDTVIVLTAGNHDSGARLEVSRRLWQSHNVHVFGSCRRDDDGTFDPSQYILPVKDCGYVIAVPYFHRSNYPAAEPGLERGLRQKAFFSLIQEEVSRQNVKHLPVVMMAHLAVAGCDVRGHEDKIIGGMDTDALEELGSGYDYLALGHIHKPQTLRSGKAAARYSGSPFPLSFTEDYGHSVTVVELPEHGAEPQLRVVGMDNLRKVVTIPEEGTDTETALALLSAFPATDPSYVRLLIDQEGIIPADAENRASSVVEGKSCRFCEIRKKPRPVSEEDADGLHVTEVADMRRIPPIDIARRYFLQKNGYEMNDELNVLMQSAIDAVIGQEDRNEEDPE